MPKYYLLFLCSLFSHAAFGQGIIDKVVDLMEFNLGKPSDTLSFSPKVVLAPVVYYEPRTSFGFGVGGRLLFKPKGAGEETRTSNIPMTISYTLNNQFFFSSGFTVFFPQEKYLVRGNLAYADFPQEFYGRGNFTTQDDRIDISYQRLLIEPLLLKQVAHELFIGGGIRYARFFNTRLEENHGELVAGQNLQKQLGSTSLGAEFALSYDGRDNVVNGSKGIFAEFTHGLYDQGFGSSHSFQLSKLDFRAYRKLSPKQVAAFQFFARNTIGDAPVQELSSLGGEMLLRGFQEERFRDQLAVFTQLEWRWQLLESIGVVAYGGIGRVADGLGDLSINGLYGSLGTGLRLCVIPSENINLRIDYALGFGPTRDSGFYLGLGEAF